MLRCFYKILLFIGFNIICLNSFAENKVCGEIKQVTGKVDVLRVKANQDSERMAIRVTTPFDVWCTDVVVTRPGSRAKIKLDSSLLTMSPNTRLNIASVKKGTQSPSVLNLTFGKIRAFFKDKDSEQAKKDRQSKLRVKTPTAVVGVRGTDFFVGFDPNKLITTQATIKGEVEVEQVGTGQKAVVDSGKQVEVKNIEKETAKKILDLKKEEIKIEMISKKESVNPTLKNQLEMQKQELSTLISPLEVKPIENQTVVAIRQTSPLVKQDSEFTSPEAIQVLGTPVEWVPAQDEIPGDLKDIKNVF